MKHLTLAFIVLLVWGAVKIPWENGMDARIKNIRYGNFAPFVGETRLQLGQGLALAALGGFRGLAANFIWLKVTEAWEKTEWVRLRSFVEMAVMMQPRVEFFWEIGAWHLAWNASIATENFSGEKNVSRRRLAAKNWIEAGRDLLQRGTLANPESFTILVRLGDLHWQRLNDFRAAAKYYAEAAQRPGALPYIERFVGMMLEKAGDNQAAYDYYVKLWNERNNPYLIHPHYPERDQMLQTLIKKFETNFRKNEKRK